MLGNDGKKNMSEMNLFHLKDDKAQHLEAGQSGWEKAKSLITRIFEEG